MRVNKTKVSLTIAFCLYLLLVSALIINADRNKLSRSYVYSIDSYGIHRLDTITDSEKVIFNTAGMHKVSFSLSPSDTVIAVLITERGIVLPGEHDYSVLPKNSLVIIDVDGNEITTLDEDVRKLSWSPDGEKIAYITGTYYEGGVGFMTTGVWIFNLRDHSKTQIKKDFPHQTVKTAGGELFEGGGFEINWAEHDSNIYIQDFGYVGGVYRYNTKISKSEKVDYKGIDFSPDGKYYSRSIPEVDYQVYLTETNQPVTERLSARFKDLRFVPTWVPDEKHYLKIVEVDFIVEPVIPGRRGGKILGVKQKKYTIYDIDTDQIIKEWIEKPEE